MAATQFLAFVVLIFALYLCWSFFRGSTGGVPLYAIAVAVLVSLPVAAFGQLFNLRGLVEVLNMTAIGLSLACLPSSGDLWEQEMRRDLARMRLYDQFKAADMLSWRVVLKAVDRLGAGRVAFLYLGAFTAALALAALAMALSQTGENRVFGLGSLVAPALFAALSAHWVYRSARRVVPGA